MEEKNEKYVLKLKKPYMFEGTEYEEIDLSGIEQMTVNDAIDIQAMLFSEQEVAASVLTETTTAFARMVAWKATGLPIEFFKMMPRGMNKAVTRAVQGVLNAKSGDENHVLKLEKPYTFQGETYSEIDLTGLFNMNSMNESTAENKMTYRGFVVTETTTNYYYACCMASMATGKPEEFFTGLPFIETIKLKNAVNSEDFFG